MNIQIQILETAVRRLTDANQDGCGERNDIGWSSRDQAIGHSLCRQIGSWSPAQATVAWKICSTYRQTQLADLDIPAYSPAEAAKLELAVADAAAAKVAASGCDEANGWNLKWSDWRTVSTKAGPRRVKSANLVEGSQFWSVWRAQKESLKARGYGVSQWNGSWSVSLWEQTGKPAVAAPVTETVISLPEINADGLLPYQIPSVQRLVASLRSRRAVLDASDVGTGKTYSALKACQVLGLRPLVVCPKSVIPSWKKAAKHFGMEIDAVNYELVRRGSTQWADVTEVNKKDIVEWTVPAGTALIFDEVHRCKGQSSLNSKLLIAARRQNIVTLALSATAATNPTEMKAIGYLLGLFDSPSSHWSWCKNNGCREGRWGGIEFGGSALHLRNIHGTIFPQRGTRIRVADLGDAFPETQVSVQTVELNGKTAAINEAYRLAEEAVERVEEKQAEDGNSHLTLMLRARQISEASKLPLIAEQVDDAVEQGMSVAVFVNFQDSLATLAEVLKAHSPVTIHGGQTAEERQAAIDGFQADTRRVIIANIQAGGVGVSLHDLNGNHPRLAIISPTWSAVDLRQTLGRVHRAGGKTKSIQRLVYAAGTVEERVASVVESKLARLDTLNDGELSTVTNKQ